MVHHPMKVLEGAGEAIKLVDVTVLDRSVVILKGYSKFSGIVGQGRSYPEHLGYVLGAER